jgi:hypothetical protein
VELLDEHPEKLRASKPYADAAACRRKRRTPRCGRLVADRGLDANTREKATTPTRCTGRLHPPPSTSSVVW